MISTTAALRAGDRLDQYRIVEPIGEGAFTIAYRAQDEAGRDVAIKLARAPEARDHLAHEARLAAAVVHPGVLRVLETRLDANPAYVVTEFCAGGSLRTLIDRGPLGANEAERIILELLRALDFAHAKGVVHRDLKPENVLLDGTGRVRIADFGHAVAPPVGLALSTGMGDEGEVKGTLDYMAPEQRTGEGDHRVDLYAVGVIAFELVAGQRPDRNDDLADLARHLGIDALTRWELLYRGLATRLERRFATAREAMAVLARPGERVPGPVPSTAPRAAPDSPPSMKPLHLALGLGVAILITVVGGLLATWASVDTPTPETAPTYRLDPPLPREPDVPPARILYADDARARHIESAVLAAARTGEGSPGDAARAAGSDGVRVLINAMCELDLGKLAELDAMDRLDSALRAGSSLNAPRPHDASDHSLSGESERKRLREDWLRAFHTHEAGR